MCGSDSRQAVVGKVAGAATAQGKPASKRAQITNALVQRFRDKTHGPFGAYTNAFDQKTAAQRRTVLGG